MGETGFPFSPVNQFVGARWGRDQQFPQRSGIAGFDRSLYIQRASLPFPFSLEFDRISMRRVAERGGISSKSYAAAHAYRFPATVCKQMDTEQEHVVR